MMMAKRVSAILPGALLALLALLLPSSSGKTRNYVINNFGENEIQNRRGRIYLIVEMTNNIFDEISYKIVDEDKDSLEVGVGVGDARERADAERRHLNYYDSREAPPSEMVNDDNYSDSSSEYEVYLVIRNKTVYQDPNGADSTQYKIVVNNLKVKLDLKVPGGLVRNFALNGFHDHAEDRFG